MVFVQKSASQNVEMAHKMTGKNVMMETITITMHVQMIVQMPFVEMEFYKKSHLSLVAIILQHQQYVEMDK